MNVQSKEIIIFAGNFQTKLSVIIIVIRKPD